MEEPTEEEEYLSEVEEEEVEADKPNPAKLDEDQESDADPDEDQEESDADPDDDGSDFADDDVEGPMIIDSGNPISFDRFSDDEDEEEEDDQYLQKLDTSLQQKIIADFHPELKSHNYDEIDILSRVVRDENGNIIDPLHKTLPFLTRYEKARVLGERAKQINSGAKPLIERDPTVIDGYIIALMEFDQKKIPFILKRPLPNGGCEYWKLQDLEAI